MSEVPARTQAPPGWYPDPGGSPGERWWDGTGWSENIRPVSGAADGPGPRGGVPVEKQSRLHVWGYVMAVIFPIVGFILGIVAATRPAGHMSKKHGVFIILVSVVAFFFWTSVLYVSEPTYDPGY